MGQNIYFQCIFQIYFEILTQMQESMSLENYRGQIPAALALQWMSKEQLPLLVMIRKYIPYSCLALLPPFSSAQQSCFILSKWVAQHFRNSGNNIFKLSWTVFCNGLNVLAVVQQGELSLEQVWLSLQNQAVALQRKVLVNLTATLLI